MKVLRTTLDFNLMMSLYLVGESVARHGWTEPIDRNSGYIFTAEDQTANDWMVVKAEVLQNENTV